MKKTSDAKPSEITDVYYIKAYRKKGDYPKPTDRTGKWLVFVDVSIVDEVWAKIKKATEDGILGNSAKVATAKPNRLASSPRRKVICIYTYDWTDEKDVKRVCDGLRGVGITQQIWYKTDEDTLNGKYGSMGYKNISKYSD